MGPQTITRGSRERLPVTDTDLDAKTTTRGSREGPSKRVLNLEPLTTTLGSAEESSDRDFDFILEPESNTTCSMNGPPGPVFDLPPSDQTKSSGSSQIEVVSGFSNVQLIEDMGDENLNKAKDIFQSLFNRSISPEEAVNSDVFVTIAQKLENCKEKLRKKKTSALWIQYMKMVDILRKSIKAERTGDFDLHLQCVQEMLPFLAASGHNNYTKSAWMYLQQMIHLEERHPEVYKLFKNGHHVVRRTERPFAGISTDLAIEQVLMRSIKSNGGLTRGTGFGEHERLVWLMCMPACAEIHQAMQDITGVNYLSSEQHVQHSDQSPARQKRDSKDIKVILKYLVNRNPFSNVDEKLRSISSGRLAADEVNVDDAESVGERILHNMVGKSLLQITFRKTDQAVTMRTNTTPSKERSIVEVDSTLLFQRLIKVAEINPDSIENVFAFEMCSVPASLFDTSGLPRKANKSALASLLWKEAKLMDEELPSQIMSYVFDGGSLLHLVPWSRGLTYNQLAQCYVQFVLKKCKGQKCTVVFDGYSNGPTTKDAAHQMRTKHCITSKDTAFAGDMLVTESKERFLANQQNKQRFIHHLCEFLLKEGIQAENAIGDADRLIVKTALEQARHCHTVVIGEDTDLLILLLFHHASEHWPVFLTSARFAAAKAKIWDIQKVQDELGKHFCQKLLFLHAFSGCDTTSAPYGLGKANFMKKATKSAVFREQAKMFLPPGVDKQTLEQAGEKAMVDVYGGKVTDSLNKLGSSSMFKSSPRLQQLSKPASFLLRQQPQNFILNGHTTKFKNGYTWMKRLILIR